MSQSNTGDKLSAVKTYFEEISGKLKTGQAREHSYRPAFEHLIKSIDGTLSVVNEPKRSEHGAPDFIFLKNILTMGYAETKDIDVDLDKVEKTEQLERYLGYSNLILTNCLDFRFFRNGERYCEPIVIGELSGDSIVDKKDQFALLAETLSDFLKGKPEQIKSGARLARIMGGKARRIRDNVARFLTDDAVKNESLRQVYETVKKLLVHDLTAPAFADMYAQTLVYGLFVARFHDTSQESFTRQEARELVPASNPFLRHFFDHIVGPDFDKRLAYIVGELCDVFANCNVKDLMEQYFKKDGKTEGPDPVIHFYEDFLKEYDAEQRKKLGAFYTPLPVVRFIVRAVDSILEKDFGLTQGLANTSKIEVTSLVQNKKVKEQVHRVQILDPATGTGTFLNEVVRGVHAKFINQAGRWNSYVDDDLLPRIYGFELMMAPYTIAHLKLGMTLADTGYKSFNHRLGIYLTNSLEEAHANDGSLFSLGLSQSIAEEAIKASQIKNEKPIMVVIGNPPYSAVSSNKSANHLVEKYKVEPGGKERLKERKNWLDDDYVKFISFAENLLAKNGEGVLAYITNNGFIDNPTFRGMRWHLLNTFDDIYVVDLHGNAKKKETAEDGGKDENVFNIMQGVSINIFIKKNHKDKKALGKIHQIDLYGKREDKFDFLNKNSIDTITWNKIEPSLPNLFFVSKGNVRDQGDYDQGFFIASHTGRHDGLFMKNSCGVVTMGDSFVVDSDKGALVKRISDFISNDISAINLKTKYDLGKNYAQWVVDNKEKISLDTGKVIRYSYRPFDDRFTIFDKNLVWRLREDVMKDIPANKYSMVFEKIAANKSQPVGIYMAKDVIDCHLTGGQSYLGNLYSIGDDNNVVSNLNPEIVEKIEEIVGKTMPETIIDYIYATLHSPSYRGKYKEFLKIDFPRVPYPTDKKSFTALSVLGKELRELHLMESTRLNNLTTTYPESGNDTVEGKYPKYKDGKVFINASQYFGNVPDVAWNYYIGGHQPAQKWLKDRKSKKLSSKDIEHYQKIITALVETVRIMGEIDKIITL